MEYGLGEIKGLGTFSHFLMKKITQKIGDFKKLKNFSYWNLMSSSTKRFNLAKRKKLKQKFCKQINLSYQIPRMTYVD